MSGSFWKFGQDYSAESAISKLLNKAFIKIPEENRSEGEEIARVSSLEAGDASEEDLSENPGKKGPEVGESEEEEQVLDDEEEDEDDHSSILGRSDENGEDNEFSQNSLPTNEAAYANYAPNLDVLDELLDDEELYTELMCSNFKLLIYLKYPEVLGKLIDYVINQNIAEEGRDSSVLPEETGDEPVILQEVEQPKLKKTDEEHEEEARKEIDNVSEVSEETSLTLPPESEEQIESRRACMAAEILSADVWPISSAIMENADLLSKLWSIMDRSPLTIVASTYFMKINERLLDMDITSMMDFILKQENIVERFLAHIANPPLMDFLLKVISTDKPDTPTGIIDTLKKQDLIPKLLDHLNPEYSTAVQSAAGDFLKAFVTISANSNNELASGIGPNELTRQLVSEEMMEKLIKIMLKGGTSLSNGVGIIIELIRKNNSDYDFVQVMYTTLETHPPSDRDPIYLGHLVKLFAKYMPLFKDILVKTKLPPLETPFGSIEPLGFERFKICELVAELLHCSNMTLINEPNGESTVRERDIARIKALRSEKVNDSSYNMEEHNDEESETKGLDEQIVTKLESLRLESDEAEIINSETATEESDDTAQGGINDVEIHSEESSDSEVTEKSLRENPIVGDQLKIALHDTEIISTILGMFFRFAWNNFLHNVVFDIVQQIFNGPLKTGYNRFLLADLLVQANITKLIMDGDKKCADYEKETGLRLGYMGHLTLIAEEVAKFSAYVEEMKVVFSDPAISESLNESSWKEYTETVLAETREKYNTVLGDFADDEEEEENPDDSINEHDTDEEAVIQESYDGQQGGLNGLKSYRSFLESAHEGDDPQSNDLEGSRYYEYINGDGTKSTLHLDPSVDYDVSEGGAEQLLPNEDCTADDDNQFSNYMSHQLGRNFTRSTHYNDDGFADDQKEEEEEEDPEEEDEPWAAASSAFSLNGKSRRSLSSKAETYDKNVFEHQFELEGEDDYMDPNDDGQSYAKPNHPLYSNLITPTASHRPGEALYNKEDAEDDISDDSDAELEEMGSNGDLKSTSSEEDTEHGYSLCRSTSKDNLPWDECERDRLMEVVNYNRQQNAGK